MWQQKLATVQRISGTLINKLSPHKRAQVRNFTKLRHTFYQDFWRTSAENIHADFKDLGSGWFLISRDGKSTFTHIENAMLDTSVTLALAANKHLMYQLLKEDGCPIPDSCLFTLDTIEKAFEFQKNTTGDVVVKPMDAWAGNGVTVNIKTPEALKQAAVYASRYGYELLVEKHISGASYRLLYLNGEFIDAVRRDPPRVIGDGISSIKQLIDKDNEARISGQPIKALSPIKIDADCKRKLEEQGMSLKYVPKPGENVIIKKVVNHNSSIDNHLVRDEVHPGIIIMGSEISKRYGIELSGLDLLTTDISKPLEETGGVINEVNTTPGLHHHVLVSNFDGAIPVGEKVLEYILENHPIIR